MERFELKFHFLVIFLLVSPAINIFARDEKFLPFFLVKIPNQICESGNGICYNSKQCQRVGGQEMESCAQGYGVCCLVTLEDCNSGVPEKVSVNGTHLISPKSSTTNSTICQYSMPKKKEVCQVRLDFIKLSIANPHFGIRDCDTDTMTVTGADNTKYIGPLCGNLTGQHMYLDYGLNSEINLNIYRATNNGQVWDVLVTYIKCDSNELAPTGCLQYYTEPSGIVQSFNYANRLQINNQDYSVCFRAINGMNKITWTSYGGNDDFTITGQPPIFPPPEVPLPPLTNPLSGDNCMTDWVMIYGENKYCGNYFPEAIMSTTKPFMIQVHFDNQELTPPSDCPNCLMDDENAGFRLKYSESP